MGPYSTRKEQIGHKELLDALDYNEDTGVFVWKKRVSYRINVGKVAGSLGQNGYLYIRVKGTSYLAHRLAWFYVYGVWPKHSIDHINGKTTDNSINNLRDVTHQDNHRNSSRHLNAKGYTKHHAGWMAQARDENGHHYVGIYQTQEEAADAARIIRERVRGEIIHNPPTA
jgi:hypothetical protein